MKMHGKHSTKIYRRFLLIIKTLASQEYLQSRLKWKQQEFDKKSNLSIHLNILLAAQMNLG
jgi:hypothetical protein